MTLLEKAQRLADQAQAKSRDHKREVWEAIQRDYPDSAELIEAYTRKFGRMSRVIVKPDNGEVLDSERMQK